MIIVAVLGILFPVTYVAHILASKAETVAEASNIEQFSKLQNQFLVVYFLATFSDWLQGPYMYQVYSNYGYTQPQIVLLYVTGFFSSMIFGTGVSQIHNVACIQTCGLLKLYVTFLDFTFWIKM
jgi:hypothetical protein